MSSPLPGTKTSLAPDLIDRANMLEVGASELGGTISVADVSHGRGPRTLRKEVKRHDSDCKSLSTLRGVGGR